MVANSNSQITTALTVAVGIFFIAILLPKLIFSSALPLLMTTQGLELLLSLLAIVIFGKSKFSKYGFCKPKASQ